MAEQEHGAGLRAWRDEVGEFTDDEYVDLPPKIARVVEAALVRESEIPTMLAQARAEERERCVRECWAKIPPNVLKTYRHEPSAQLDQRTAFEMGLRIEKM